MRLFTSRSKKPPGSSPGTVTFIGDKKIDRVRIQLMRYTASTLEEVEFDSIDSCLPCKKSEGIKWINIDGLHDTSLLQTVGRAFNIHDLVLEDIVNTNQRPKVEIHDDYVYVVLRMFSLDEAKDSVVSEQMSFILGSDYILSFQERAGDVFEQVRKRLRTGGKTGRIRKDGSDYLMYSLLDAIVDHYFIILDQIGSKLESLDETLTHRPTPDTLESIHEVKQEVILLRKQVWPLREMFNSLLKSEVTLINDSTRIFLRDVYDHVIQILDILEGYREILSGMLDMYQSAMGNRLNEVMKVLTIIATIFIPPTFVAGIYGMNFENMPELHSQSGYFIVLGVMVASIVSMLVYFRKKHWI